MTKIINKVFDYDFETGYYTCTLSSSDTDTSGILYIKGDNKNEMCTY